MFTPIRRLLPGALAILFLVILGSAPSLAQAPKEFWVGPWGDPNQTWDNCTPNEPFATLDQARLQVRAYRSDTQAQPQHIFVHIAGGEYFLDAPVFFTADDAGWDPVYAIKYVAWNPQGIGGVYDDDVLFSGGYRSSGWQADGTIAFCDGRTVDIWKTTLPAGLPAPTDVWVNRRRMIKARYPNLPAACPWTLWDGPDSAPCRHEGRLLVWDVDRHIDPPTGKHYQRLLLHRMPGSHIGEWPQNIAWSEVEVVASPLYVSARQRVQAGNGFVVNQLEAMIQFEVTLGVQPIGSGPMDLGALGVYKHEDPDTHHLREIHVLGHEEVMAWTPPRPDLATQVYLEGARAFLDAPEEWHYDPGDRTLRLALCGGQQVPEDIMVPVLDRLLVLLETSNIEFHGLDWAYTRFELPTQADRTTPGYSPMHAGHQWIEGAASEQESLLPGAIQLLGARECFFYACRIGHTGASGITVEMSLQESWGESHDNVFWRCEVLDTGGHGIVIGDQRAEISDWNDPPSPIASVPLRGNKVIESLVWEYGLIYKDAAGINVMNTRDTVLYRNQIGHGTGWFEGNQGGGNWSGIRVGNVRRSAHATAPCNEHWHTTEGTIIERNRIVRACMGLLDCGGIYISGSHPGMEIWGNYIVSMQPNPQANLEPGTRMEVNGIRWDRGAEQTFVGRNLVQNVHVLFHFDTQAEDPGEGPPETGTPFGKPTSPVSWCQACPGTPPPPYYCWWGQLWTGQDPEHRNRWLYPSDPNHSYWKRFHPFERAFGHGLLPMGASNPPNVIIPGTHNDPIALAIIAEAGPADFELWFPSSGERIYRLPRACDPRCMREMDALSDHEDPDPGDETIFDLWEWEWDW
jgi:hypothetical protein